MKYHHDRLHPREPRAATPDGTAAGHRAGATHGSSALSELLDGDGAPQEFEQARCAPRRGTRDGSQPRAHA